MKLRVMRGLPASGKTTLAETWVAEDPENRARVNRDDIRAMAHNGLFIAEAVGPGTEHVVRRIRDAMIQSLLAQGVDVVSDDTNLQARDVRELRRLAVIAGAEFEVVDLTDVPLEECLRRNAAREKAIPASAVESMFTRFVLGHSFPLPVPDAPATVTVQGEEIKPYVRMEGLRKVFLVDMDGTLALMGTRSPFDETKVSKDRPNRVVVDLVDLLMAAGYGVIIMSARTSDCMSETRQWLSATLRATPDMVLMRPASGPLRGETDWKVKLSLFNDFVRDNFDVVGVVDDRQQVVDMWCALGIPVFQVHNYSQHL